jgi:hypothetical protein
MNVTKTAVVSTISLIIAMSAAALSAGPSLAAQAGPARQQAQVTPQIPITGKQACKTTSLTLPAGVSTDTGLTIPFTIGVPRVITVLFSSEITVAAAGNTVNLDYKIDGVLQPVFTMGPEFFADDTFFTSRTAFGLRTTTAGIPAPLAAGTHTITPFLTAFGAGGGTAFIRCFSAGRQD